MDIFYLVNFSLKAIQKRESFDIGLKNFYFYFYFFKKILNFKKYKFFLKFIKSKKRGIMILKSPIKYKISKHIINKNDKHMLLTLKIFDFKDINYINANYYLNWLFLLKHNFIFNFPLCTTK